MNQKHFALVIPPFGATLVGVIEDENFRNWVAKKEMLVLFEPKRLVMVSAETQPGDPNSHTSMLQMVPPYYGDSPQEKLYVDQAAVEVIGDIEGVGNDIERCTNNNRMFLAYQKICKDWRMSRSNLVAPTVQDVANINNISKLPRKK
jgi:hypothetical protein